MPLKPKSNTSKVSPPSTKRSTANNTRPGFIPRSHYDALLLRSAEAEADVHALLRHIFGDDAYQALLVACANDWHQAVEAALLS